MAKARVEFSQVGYAPPNACTFFALDVENHGQWRLERARFGSVPYEGERQRRREAPRVLGRRRQAREGARHAQKAN